MYRSVREPAFPSVMLGESIETVRAPSSSAIVPVPDARAMVAFSGFDSVTTTVSFDSDFVSGITGTVTVFLVCPAAKVRVPGTSAV